MIIKIMKKQKNEVSKEEGGIPPSSSKLEKPSGFCKLSSTNELIDECKKQTQLEVVHYNLCTFQLSMLGCTQVVI